MVLKAKGLKKRFGTFEALSGVDFELKKGEVVSIIGPSGSGKSTFLRALAGLELIDSGEIQRPDQSLGKMGMVFQQFNLFPHLNVLENLTLAPIRVQKKTFVEAEKKALDLLTQFGLLSHSSKFPKDLSGGEQQRVAIARSLMMDPDVILFDEPTSSLDPEKVREVLVTIQKLAESGSTLMVVTHEMEFARQISSRVLFFSEGKILEEGSPSEIFAQSTRSKDSRIGSFLDQVLAFH